MCTTLTHTATTSPSDGRMKNNMMLMRKRMNMYENDTCNLNNRKEWDEELRIKIYKTG